MAHIPVKLEKQGKQCQLCIRIFNQNSLGIQFSLSHIRSETLRNQCKFPDPVIAHIVVDSHSTQYRPHKNSPVPRWHPGTVIRIPEAALALHRTPPRPLRSSVMRNAHFSGYTSPCYSIRHIIPPSFNKSLQFHTVQHLHTAFRSGPGLRLIIKNPGIIQNCFH